MTINLRSRHSKAKRRQLHKYVLKYRVIGDGKDVTKQCFYYDGRRRIAGFNKLNDKGQAYVDPLNQNEIAVEFKKFRRLRIVKK